MVCLWCGGFGDELLRVVLLSVVHFSAVCCFELRLYVFGLVSAGSIRFCGVGCAGGLVVV